MSKSEIPTRRDAFLAPPPSRLRGRLLDARLREPAQIRRIVEDTTFLSATISFVLSLIGAGVASGDLGPGLSMGIVPFFMSAFVGCFLTCFTIIGLGRASTAVGTHDRNVLCAARGRVLGLINDGHGFTIDEEVGHYARSVVCNPDDWNGGRDLLMRLDAVAVRHSETADRIKHDAAKALVARGIARDACYDMIASFREACDEDGVDGEIEDLSRACRAIATGRSPDAPIAVHAPTARIGRIISTAERMLSHRPDLTDAGGARIDALVRIHVPRLLERHRIAAETASPDCLDAVDAQLDVGVERIRASVQEAADAIHDDAMQALATELRFLELRRTTATPLLTAVA
jgi:hypothetical protein